MEPSTPIQGILVPKLIFVQIPNFGMETCQEITRPALIYKRSPDNDQREPWGFTNRVSADHPQYACAMCVALCVRNVRAQCAHPMCAMCVALCVNIARTQCATSLSLGDMQISFAGTCVHAHLFLPFACPAAFTAHQPPGKHSKHVPLV